MTPPPLVSVIIPCFAQGHFLRDAITSVLRQSHTHHEVIVVNDGAPDTYLIERVVGEFGDRVRYVAQANSGLSGARNTGLQHARGEFVICLDADDRLLPEAMTLGLAAWSAHPSTGLVWGFHLLIDESGNPSTAEEHVRFAEGSYEALLERNTIGCPVNVMFHRAKLIEAGGFSTEQRYAEDYELFLRLVRRHGAHCHGGEVAEYRLHGSNMSRNHRGMLEGVLRALALQEPFTRNDARLEQARQRGERAAWVMFDGDPMIWRFAGHAKAGRLLHATALAAVLLVRYPRKFTWIVTQRIRRAITPRAAERTAPVPE